VKCMAVPHRWTRKRAHDF